MELARLEQVPDLNPNEAADVTYSWAEIETIGLRRIEAHIIPPAGPASAGQNTENDTAQTHVVVDIDGDNDIDIVDIMKVASIWHKEKGDENFNPICDMDNSERIDIVDIMLVAIKWSIRLPE